MEIVIVLVILALMGGAFFALLKGSMKLGFKLLLNSILGFVILWFVNFFGSIIGIHIGMNWVNALIVGLFGMPGVGLLLILLMIFRS